MAYEALAIQGIDTAQTLARSTVEYDRLRGSRSLEDQNLRVSIISSVSRIIRGSGSVTPEAIDLLARALEDDAEYVPARAAQ
jgi:hypothetical protein